MPIFNDISEVKKYINVSKLLDIKLILPYEGNALRKVYEFIPEVILDSVKKDYPKIYDHVKKSIANYMVAFAIPFIKIHLSNTGGNNFEDNKLKKADWWDVRDYGLSAVRMADESLTVAINELLKTPVKKDLNIGEHVVFATPQEFSELYSIGNSWDVFKKIQPIMKYVWRVYIRTRLKKCSIEDLLKDPESKDLLMGIVAFYTVAEAVSNPTLLFTNSAIVLQWEELPWQRSKVIESKDLERIKQEYTFKANEYFNILLEYLKKNHTSFPCFEYSSSLSVRKIIEKKSGLYL